MKIPELFLWHRKDFISGHDLAEIAVESDGLVAFIASHLSVNKIGQVTYMITAVEWV